MVNLPGFAAVRLAEFDSELDGLVEGFRLDAEVGVDRFKPLVRWQS